MALVLAGLVVTTTRGDVNRVIHVSADSQASPATGITWSSAFKFLQDALEYVHDNPNTTPGTWDEIWVKHGVYRPDQCTDTSTSGYVCRHHCKITTQGHVYEYGASGASLKFCMQDRLRIYGGFDGTETNLSERDADPDPFTVDQTKDSVLSGDLGVNDPIVEPCAAQTCSPSQAACCNAGGTNCAKECCKLGGTWTLNPSTSIYDCRDQYGLLVARSFENSYNVVSGPNDLIGWDGSAPKLM